MHYNPSPKILHLEISSMCNALCLGCARTDKFNYTSKNQKIDNKTYIHLDVFEKILSQMPSLYRLEFSGTVDDPFMHPYFKEILQIVTKFKNITKVLISTNGGARDPQYYAEVAEVLDDIPDTAMLFSIDGLSDTNHIYRQRTHFDRIMKNAEAFINAGGKAQWQYIVFPWNQHQLEEAEAMSKAMGFHSFNLRHDKSQIKKESLTIEDIERQRTVPEAERPVLYPDMNVYEDTTCIDCLGMKESSYMLDYNAKLWPCVFLRNREIIQSERSQSAQLMYNIYGDPNWNNLGIHDVQDVISHPFYAKHLTSSFYSGTIGREQGNKLSVCVKSCGIKADGTMPIREPYKRIRNA